MQSSSINFQEFYKSSNSQFPVRISFQPELKRSSNPNLEPFKPKCSSIYSKNKKYCFTKTRSISTVLPFKKESQENLFEKSPFVENSDERQSCGPIFKVGPFELSNSETKCEKAKTPDVFTKFEEIKENARNSTFSTRSREKSTFAKINSATENPETLKNKLTSSLSPSPFKISDPLSKDAEIQELVSSEAAPAKKIIFSQFYDSEINSEGSYFKWKIAMKDHILHTLESISLINELLLEEKREENMETKENEDGKRKSLIFDLDETLVHCVTENIQTAQHIINIQLDSGENIRVFFLLVK